MFAVVTEYIDCSLKLLLRNKEYDLPDRYQVLAGIIEQRLLEPLLHQHKLVLGALCFAARTGNTYLGSLL
jgi:hypothetical protein